MKLGHNQFVGVHPDELHERFRFLGRAWADAERDATEAEKKAKRVFSALVIEAEGSIAQREHHARASETFTKADEDATAKRHLANLAKADLDAAEVWFNWTRSMESTRRKQMEMV